MSKLAVEELQRRIRELQESHTQLRDEMSRLIAVPAQPRPRPDTKKVGAGLGQICDLEPCGSGLGLMDMFYVNVLQSVGQAVYVYDVNYRVIYWNRGSERLFGFTAAEALGSDFLSIVIEPHNRDVAFDIINHVKQSGETWTGQFPVIHKMGRTFLVIITLNPFYDDDGTLVGLIAAACDSKPFKEKRSTMNEPTEAESVQMVGSSRMSVTSNARLESEQPFQSSIGSKLTNLATKVSTKVRSKMKIGEDDGNPVEASALKGDPVSSVFGVFIQVAAVTSRNESQRESTDEGEGKTSLHKMTSKAEVWIQKKAKQWPWKGNDQQATKADSSHFGLPWSKGQQDSDHRPDFAARSAVRNVVLPAVIEAFESSSSFAGNSASSGSTRSRALIKSDPETDSLDYEILWEELTIRNQIGRGSCGTVYHGLWHELQDVAIKVFSKHDYSKDAILSFRQEVSLMKRLRHPNILLFMGAVTSPHCLCIVSEYLPRGSLFYLLQKRASKLNYRRRTQMALDIAQGMNYLHNCNPPIVHHDLKTSNLLADKNWTIKVADFGLSRVKHETYLITKTGKGTPQWMAPEVLRNEPSNEMSDIYSFGVILWELATQKIPWEHLNPMQVIGVVGFMNQRLEIPEDVDPRWATIIQNCWQSEPQERPTFKQLLEELRDLQRQFSVEFRAASAELVAKEL